MKPSISRSSVEYGASSQFGTRSKSPSRSGALRLGALLFAVTAMTLVASETTCSERKEGIPKEFSSKKLIAVGWDSPTPSILLQHLNEIEQTPFAGVRIVVETKDDAGEKIILDRIFNSRPWKREWFNETIEILKKAQSPKLTDNFLGIGTGSTLDWFDDAGWAQVTDHFRVAAWIAKQSGLKGLLFNPEVGVRLPAFSYNQQPERAKHSFGEYTAKVRQRGREVMEAMAQEYPDMTLFCMFLNGGQAYSPFYRNGGTGWDASHFYSDGGQVKAAGPTNPSEVQEQIAPIELIEGGSYNLIPAFVNGWLDAIPPGMTIVDGLEQTYTATEKSSFIAWAHNVRNTALPMVASENRAKYRAQVQPAFGVYLDPYTNPVGSKYYIGPGSEYNGPSEGPEASFARVKRLESTVEGAIQATDEYVWLWGEKHYWWPAQDKRISPESWETIAPGISDALRFAVDPSIRFKRNLTDANQRFLQADQAKRQNLVKNGDFLEPAMEPWSFLAESAPGGGAGHDSTVGRERSGSVKISGSYGSACGQDVGVTKGSGYYGVRAWVRQSGNGDAKIRIRWRKGENSYLLTQSDNIFLSPIPSKKQGDWMPVEGVVAVPPGMNQMSIQLMASGQETTQDAVWFDDVGVYKID